MTHHAAVIGSPIAHSLSPVLHRAAYQQLGLHDWEYDAIEVTPDTLGEFIASRDNSWAGLSVTAPLKEALIEFGRPDQQSSELQSANTLIFGHPNRLFNTDVTGVRDAMASYDVIMPGTAVIMGAGATARSAISTLVRLGCRVIRVVARDAGRAHASLDRVAALYGTDLQIVDWSGFDALGADSADVLISTAPVQYTPEEAAQLAAVSQVVFDIVYQNYPTNLSRAAIKAGRVSVDGVDLLVHQAIDQVRLMTGEEPLAEPLIEVCRAELAKR